MPVTLKDVAAKIGVSYSTVSRAVNPDTAALVNSKTRERILAAVKKYGYIPNRSAAVLRRNIKNTPIIGFTSGQFPHFLCGEFPTKVFNGVIEAAERLGSDIELFPVLQGNSGELSRQLQLRRALDGVVIFGCDARPEFAGALSELHIPTVVIGNCTESSLYRAYVYCDGRVGAEKAVDHLIGLGRERIAIILGSAGSIDGAWRFEGYKRALEKHSIPLDYDRVYQGGFNRRSGYEVGYAMLRDQNKRPDAVFCSNDDMAIGLLKAFYEASVRCPEEVAVVGFDDIEQATYTAPPLTSVHHPATALGQRAVEMIIEMIQTSSNLEKVVVIPTELVVRASCGAGAPALARSA